MYIYCTFIVHCFVIIERDRLYLCFNKVVLTSSFDVLHLRILICLKIGGFKHDFREGIMGDPPQGVKNLNNFSKGRRIKVVQFSRVCPVDGGD